MLFPFPSDERLRDKWIAAIKREMWKLSKDSKICSHHFITSKLLQIWFFSVLIFCYSAGKPVRGPLHPNYVPSVFAHTIQVAKATSSRYFEPSSALLNVHCTSPLELESKVRHISLQVVNRTNKKQITEKLRVMLTMEG